MIQLILGGRNVPYFERSILTLIKRSNTYSVWQAEVYTYLLNKYAIDVLYQNGVPRRKPMPFKPITFLHIKLDDKQKKGFPAFVDKAVPDLNVYLTNLVLDGYKLSLSFAEKSSTFVASVTCRTDDSVNKGLCVTSHHSDADMAIFVALYKHFVILGEDPWSETVKGDDWG